MVKCQRIKQQRQVLVDEQTKREEEIMEQFVCVLEVYEKIIKKINLFETKYVPGPSNIRRTKDKFFI